MSDILGTKRISAVYLVIGLIWWDTFFSEKPAITEFFLAGFIDIRIDPIGLHDRQANLKLYRLQSCD